MLGMRLSASARVPALHATTRRTLGEQEVVTRGALAVLHHVVTGNYFIALHTEKHGRMRRYGTVFGPGLGEQE